MIIAKFQDNVTFTYDKVADVLYITFGKPREAIAEEFGDGIFLRFNKARDELLGITILDIKRDT